MIEERWLPAVGFEGRYEVSDLGRVKSLPRLAIDRLGRRKPIRGGNLRAACLATGYAAVTLEGRTIRINTLVMAAFVGPRPAGKQVLHRNDNRMDPRLSNLRYGTAQENSDEAVSRGRLVRGEARATSKLTDERVMAARALAPGYTTMSRVALAFGVSVQTISHVVNRHQKEGWAHVVRGMGLREAARVLLIAERAHLIRAALPLMVCALESCRAQAT